MKLSNNNSHVGQPGDGSHGGQSYADHLYSLEHFARSSPGQVNRERFISLVSEAGKAIKQYLDGPGGDEERDQIKIVCPALRDSIRSLAETMQDGMASGDEHIHTFYTYAVHLGARLGDASRLMTPDGKGNSLQRIRQQALAEFNGHQPEGELERELRTCLQDCQRKINAPADQAVKWWHNPPKCLV